MPEIDNLSIRISASADNVSKNVDHLASALNRLKGNSTSAANGMKAVDAGMKSADSRLERVSGRAERAGRNLKDVGKSAEDSGKAAKRGASGLGSFWESLKRIAYYRFIRSVLKGITAAFKEGITNLYHWSNAVNKTFAKSMDRLASSTLYLKNSLGAMLAPIIERLTPVIEWIIDRIVDAINWINKLFAALSGSQTYVVAKKVATKWKDAGESVAGSAKSAADDIRRTLLGFDEINRLDLPNKSSGSGGSGTSGNNTDYTNMFEERKLDGWMSKLAAFIDKFNLGVPGVIAGILAGVTSISLAFKALSKRSLKWLKDMAGKTISIGVSLLRKGWTTLHDWAVSFGEAIVDLAVRIKTSAAELWAKFASEWVALSPVLKAGIVVSTTAAALWLAYKIAWALVPDKVLQVQVAIKTKAQELKTKLILGWSLLGAWALGVKLKLSTTAAQLKNDIVSAWSKLTTWALAIKLRVETKASKLFKDISDAWGEKELALKLGISTKLSTLWTWVKNNWKIVAGSALAIAIAIATPWSTLAKALSVLWADVMASFGGSLAFGVTPMYDPVVEGQKKADGLRKKVPVSKYGTIALPGGGGLPGSAAGRNKNNIEKTKVSVSLVRDGWKSLSDWVGTDVTVKTSLQRLGWTTLADWMGNNVVAFVSLAKKNWSSLGSWVGDRVTAYVNLVRGNFRSLSDWIGKTINVGVNLFSNWISRRKNGGILSDGMWSDIPQYANGTRNAHGSLFLAGEAGPEIVGHVGGRTEILNRSQLASTMYSSVIRAMTPAMSAIANAVNATAYYNSNDDSSVMEAMLDEMRAMNESGINPAALADAMVSAMQRAGIGAVYLDGRQLAESINRETRRRGSPAIVF